MLPTSAARESSVDTAALYEANRQRFISALRAASHDQLELTLGPTPEWRVRDVLAHVVGITADMNALDFGAGDADAWTRRQVETRHDRSIDEIVSEWDRESTTFEEGLVLLGYSIGAHYVGDLHAHLQDVHMTLGLPAVRDPETVMVALDFYLESLDEALRDDGPGAIEIVVGDEHHVAGGDSPIASLRGDPFEVLRCLSGRRSLPQIQALDWTGDVGRMAPSLSRYPLPARSFAD